MSKPEIPDEAVAAAARATQEVCETYDPGGWTEEENWAIWARQILEAAAPFIAARVLEDAADAFEDLPVNKGATISTGTFDWFELFPVQHIRDRAQSLGTEQ